MAGLPVRELFEKIREELHLTLVTDPETLSREITTTDIHRPGLAMAGYTDYFLDERVQILGETEISYLKTLDEGGRLAALDRGCGFPLVCLIITKSLEVPEGLLERLESHGTAVLRTPMDTTPFIHALTGYLRDAAALTTTIHGTMVDVYGVGLMLAGASGIGKSECALDLVERGHRLVADDVVTIVRKEDDILIGAGSELLKHHMELRGIGIIDIRTMFGIRAVRAMKRLEVVVRLEEWDEDRLNAERLGLDDRTVEILGVPITTATIPIFPGKNLSVLSEVIALNYLQKAYGQHPAREFNERLREWMRKQAALRQEHRHDLE